MSFLVREYHTYVQWEVQVLLLYTDIKQVHMYVYGAYNYNIMHVGTYYVMFIIIIGKDLYLVI